MRPGIGWNTSCAVGDFTYHLGLFVRIDCHSLSSIVRGTVSKTAEAVYVRFSAYKPCTLLWQMYKAVHIDPNWQNVKEKQENITLKSSLWWLTIGAHAQRGLELLFCVSVCLFSLFRLLALLGRYQRLQRRKCNKIKKLFSLKLLT